MIKAVDLFCGAGGLTHGLERAGINVIAGYDIDGACRFAYETNNNAVFIQKSVTDIDATEFERYYQGAEIRVLAGCAPCQPFSSYNKKRSTDERVNDSRWTLLTSFGDHVELVQPEIVTMENVPGLIKQDVFAEFVERLEGLGYHVSYRVVFCPEYGLPQSRSRLVLLASLLGEINLIAPTHTVDTYKTLREAIGHLPALGAGEVHPSDILHRTSKMSELNMQRIIASRPGGTWKDWPEYLVADCHKKSSGSTYSAVYGRMSWDKVGSTITTQCMGFGNGRFGHPEQNRAISLREAAILQSFPDDYRFWPEHVKFDIRPVARMIGNAVPVRLGEIVGQSIIEHLNMN